MDDIFGIIVTNYYGGTSGLEWCILGDEHGHVTVALNGDGVQCFTWSTTTHVVRGGGVVGDLCWDFRCFSYVKVVGARLAYLN